MIRRLAGLALSVLVLSASACGSETASNDGSSDDEAELVMNFGDPDAVPANRIADADLSTGSFVVLDSRPEGYDDAAGVAHLARHPEGTTVTVEMSGLAPGVDHIVHVHAGPCVESGAAHYRFDPDGPSVPPNEIHLAFTSAGDGAGFMSAENDDVAGPDAVSVVVHQIAAMDSKIACADLV